MSSKLINTDNPAELTLTLVNTSTQNLLFEKEAGDSFNSDAKFVVTTERDGKGTTIKRLTVGNGITINGNNLELTIKGSDYNDFVGKTIYAIGDIINQGLRDIIITIILKYNPS